MGLEKIARHRRNQGARKEERGDKGEDDRLGKRPEQITSDAAELEHRREYDIEHKQRHESRYDDLLGAVENRRFDILALFEMKEDVLERHRAFVDQHADRERQTSQGHDVDGLAEQ